MMDSSREALESDEPERGDAPARSDGKLALALGVIAIALEKRGSLGCLSRLWSVAWSARWQGSPSRRRVSAGWSCAHREQSQTLAQQASQAAASAQTAAPAARLGEAGSIELGGAGATHGQQAAAQQQRADQATQQAEAYRKEREAELAQLQQALGQIAETRRTAMGLVMTLDSKSIRFDFDKANVKPEYRDILNRIAGILMTLKGYTIAVYGYTDDVGTQTYNLQLSQHRAEAVRDFLVQTGISPTIMSTKGCW